jgi:senataxin
VENTDNAFKRFCLVGHTEVQRKDVDGLILKVSKRKWALIGTPSMYLLRIGGNITALREFTALCGVETIPLKKYLLGHHLEVSSNKGATGTTKSIVKSSSIGTIPENQKEALLNKMGGVQALGKGFTEYAQRKFNPSQLMAISASSTGCKCCLQKLSVMKIIRSLFSHVHEHSPTDGEGGITLIKGPPGTGVSG